MLVIQISTSGYELFCNREFSVGCQMNQEKAMVRCYKSGSGKVTNQSATRITNPCNVSPVAGSVITGHLSVRHSRLFVRRRSGGRVWYLYIYPPSPQHVIEMETHNSSQTFTMLSGFWFCSFSTKGSPTWKMFWKKNVLENSDPPPLTQHPHPIFGQRPKHIFLLGASLTVEFCIRSQGSLDICSSLAWENLKCLRKVQPGNAASSYICQIMHYSAVAVISKGIP